MGCDGNGFRSNTALVSETDTTADFRLRDLRQKYHNARRSRRAIPPIAPPIIAPMGVETRAGPSESPADVEEGE